MRKLLQITILFTLVFSGCASNTKQSEYDPKNPNQIYRYSELKEKLVRISMSGYKKLGQDNYNDAHKLFNQALKLASKSSWPTYSSRKARKVLPEYIEKHKYDWQGNNKQKILGLMQVYQSVKQYFAGFEIVPKLNWDELVIEYIPKIIETKNIEEYYKLLQKLVANLHDNHTRIRIPSSIEKNIDSPPISIELIEDKFIITKVKETTEIKEQNIYPGLEIKKIEGVQSKEFFEENKLPYLALSAVQKERYYLTFNLLSGKKNTKVKITTMDLNGEEREAVLTRNSKLIKDNVELPLIEVEELESGIVYFNFRAFWPFDSVAKIFKHEFNNLDLTKTKGFIIDVRENSGGNAKSGDLITSHIINEPIEAYSNKIRVKGIAKTVTSNPLLQLLGEMLSLIKEWHTPIHKIRPYSGKQYLGPVVVLISRYTGSAAEQFVAGIRESKRAVIIGETTKGGTGNGLYSILPGYGTLRVVVGIGIYIDGTIWQGVGIEPDIEVSRKIQDIYRRYDTVLAKGLDELKGLINTN